MPPQDLRQANTLLGLARNSSMVTGAALGGVLVALVGPGVGLEIDAASFLVAAVLIWLIRTAGLADERVRKSVLRDLATG